VTKFTAAAARIRMKSDWKWAYVLIAPLFIGTLVFGIFPVLYSLFISFTDWNLLSGFSGFTGIKNYIEILSTKSTLHEIRNTLVFAAFTVPITLLFSLYFANLLNRDIKGKSIFRVIYFLPNIVMPTAVALVWRWLLNTKYGLVNLGLGALGLPTPAWISDPHFIMAALIIVSVWSGIGYNTIILLASMQNIPKEMYEAAELDGARGARLYWKVTFPLLSPSIFFLLTMGVMKAMRVFDIVFMFTNKDNWTSGGPLLEATRTMVYGIYYNAFSKLDMGLACAESGVLLILIVIMTVVQFRLQKKWVHYE